MLAEVQTDQSSVNLIAEVLKYLAIDRYWMVAKRIPTGYQLDINWIPTGYQWISTEYQIPVATSGDQRLAR